MGNADGRRRDVQVAVQDYVEIDRPCRLRRSPLPAAAFLNIEELCDQDFGREVRLPCHRHVQVRRLGVGNVDGFCFDCVGCLETRENRAEPVDGPLQVRAPITEVRAEGDGDPNHLLLGDRAANCLDREITQSPNSQCNNQSPITNSKWNSVATRATLPARPRPPCRAIRDRSIAFRASRPVPRGSG